MTRKVVVFALIACLVSVPAAAADGSEEQQATYVVRMTDDCVFDGGEGPTNGFIDTLEAGGKALFGSLMPDLPRVPPTASPLPTPCFAVPAGTTSVELEVTDDQSPVVPVYVRFFVGNDGQESFTLCSDALPTFAVPEGATRLHVIVTPFGFTGSCLGAAGTTGTVTATFA